jgi:hypothetical protein
MHVEAAMAADEARLTTGLGRRAGSPEPQDVAPKSTSLVWTVPAVRPGAVW